MWNQEEFIKTCDENVKIISQAYKELKPVKLKSFKNFEHWEKKWWADFKPHMRRRDGDIRNNRIGYSKFVIENPEEQIEILKEFSTHLFSKIFSEFKITTWTSLEDFDYGTEWHTDFERPPNDDTPTYLICMNLIGDTHWKFQGYESIDLSPGDLICQNGSVPHNVEPNEKRITIAGHSSIKNIIL